MTNLVSSNSISFDNALPVISYAQKFVISIPAMNEAASEKLEYPKGHEKEGQPITDWEGNLIGELGIVFFNYKDKAVQAVPSDGKGVIILNQITSAQAAELNDYMKGKPNSLSAADIKDILDYAKMALDLGDAYNSDTAYVEKKMIPIGAIPNFYKRDGKDVCYAVRLEGRGAFRGPAASPQIFENGAVIVKQGDDIFLVQSDVFVATYRKPDGSAIKISEVPIAIANSSQNKRRSNPDLLPRRALA